MQVSIDQRTVQKYKIPKLSANGNLGSIARATAKDEDADVVAGPELLSEVKDGEDADVVAGPELPSEHDEEIVDDEEGRFFGGGITKNTAEVLNFIDEQDKDHLRVSSHWCIF